MSVLSAVPIAEIKARGSIKDTDVLRLRRHYYLDGRITEQEAEAIFALHDACPVQDPAWAGYFVEAITDYLVDQAKPEGYLTAANAAWLTERITSNGLIETKTEMELLVSVLDKARWVPQSLVVFALNQVKDAIITGLGPLRAGQHVPPCIVTASDVELLRRIIYAYGSDGSIAVTRPEAEVLFDIDAATYDSENHPAWRDLFVKAVACCVMSVSGYAMPSRAEALAQDAWLERRGDLSLDRLALGMGAGLFAAYRKQSPEERAIGGLSLQKVEIVTNEPVTLVEANWLAARMRPEPGLTPNVRALLMYLKAESPCIHPSLQALVDKAAVAA